MWEAVKPRMGRRETLKNSHILCLHLYDMCARQVSVLQIDGENILQEWNYIKYIGTAMEAEPQQGWPNPAVAKLLVFQKKFSS